MPLPKIRSYCKQGRSIIEEPTLAFTHLILNLPTPSSERADTAAAVPVITACASHPDQRQQQAWRESSGLNLSHDCRERLLASALARLVLSMSPGSTSSSSSGSGGPSTPSRSSSGGADDGQGLRKGSPLSSVRTRLGGQAEFGQSGMQR